MARRDIRRDLVRQSLELLDDLTVVEREFGREPEALVARAFPSADPGLAPRAIVGARAGLGVPDDVPDDDAARGLERRLFEAGIGALDRIRRDGEGVDLTPEEERGLEAVIRFTARPALLFRDGRFVDPPPPWEGLAEQREAIERTARSVGRIQVPGLPTLPYAGTGFLVAPDVLMTNCHVAHVFVAQGGPQQWTLRRELEPSADLADDPDADPAVDMVVEQLIGMHERLDLALLRVAPAGDRPLPPPLTLMSQEPAGDERLYVVGYPAPDPRNDPVVMRQIFGEIYYVKRLQPGSFLIPQPGPVIRSAPYSTHTSEEDVFAHDASTLGGNSGSCVVDLDTHLVAGLHYAGHYAQFNQAVALWRLAEDSLLVAAGVEFD